MRSWVALTLLAAVAGGCNALLGVDEDYTVGTNSAAGASTTSSSHSTSSTGGLGGGGATTTSSAGGTTTSSSTTTSSGGAGAGGGSGGAGEVIYTATIADCIDTTAPSPDSCASPAEALWIDLPSTEAFLRFELDGATAGKSVSSAKLRLAVGTFFQAQGDSSGVLWQVAPFARAELFGGPPAKLGVELAPAQGPADPGTTIEWPVPAQLVVAHTPLCFGIVPSSYNDTGYLNLNGAHPPRLVVRYE